MDLFPNLNVARGSKPAIRHPAGGRQPGSFRSDINALRAFAVAVVVLFHLNVSAFEGGFAGVDVFFVISGFLMTQIALQRAEAGNLSLKQFYWARCVRIIPALLVMVCLVLIFCLVWLEPVELVAVARHAWHSLWFTSNWAYWREVGYFDAAARQKWFLHTWSLSVEWQFYLLYPLLLKLLVKHCQPRLSLWLWALALLSFAAAVFSTQWLHFGKLQSFAFYMLPTRAWEMLAGGLAYLAWRRAPLPSHKARLLGVVGWVALFGMMAGLGENLPWPSAYSLWPVLATAAILRADVQFRLTESRPVDLLGRVSYSLYLWHWPLIVGVLPALGWNGSLAWPLVIMIGLAFASYLWVEKPLSAILRRSERGPSGIVKPSRSFVLITVGAMIFCGFIIREEGFLLRVRGDRALYLDAVAASGDHGYPAQKCGGIKSGKLLSCQTAATPAKTWIIGDSFAEMWWDRAKRLVPSDGYSVKFATSTGCPPISAAYRLSHYIDCRLVHDMRISQIENDSQVEVVVIMAMWDSYFRYGRSELRIAGPAGDFPLASENGFAIAMSNLRSDVLRLQVAGKRVVIFTTAPYPGVDVPRELRRRIFQGGAVQNQYFTWQEVGRNSALVDPALKDLVSIGVDVVDLPRAFCAEAVCPQLLKGRSIYADVSHFRGSFLASLSTSPLDRYLRSH